jgi:DNA-binding Lrp family transcriptional regulator
MTAECGRLEADKATIRSYSFGELPRKAIETPMDDTDRRLIAMLRENARAPTAVLARRLGLSRTTVQARLERLERSGVVSGYGVRLSEEVERGLIRAHVLVTILPKTAPRIEAELRAIPEVRTLHSVSGSFDLIAIVEAASIGELDRLIDRIGALEGVEKTLSSIILSTRIER